MIQFDRIRKSSILRDKVYYLCNHIKFYSIKDPIVTAFYFLTQSLALISTFIASPLSQTTVATSFLHTLNSLFFFYTSDFYLRYDSGLVLSHLVSLFLFLSFTFIVYVTYSVDHLNHLAVRKNDSKKIRIVEMMVFLLITFSIPLGSFIWYYIIRLFQTSQEYLAVISLFNLIGLFTVVYVMEECSIQSDLKNYKSLSRLYSKNESIHSIVKMMVRMIIASFNNLADSIIILSLLALLAFDLYELRVSINSKKFLNSTTESIYYYKNVTTVILEILMLICLVFALPLVINNFFISTISTSILAYLALASYKQNKKMNLILDGIDSVVSEDDAKIYMLQMISMLDNRKNTEEIFTLSLITIHKEKCRLQSCFCRNFNFEGFQKIVAKEEFLRRFVLSKLEGVVQKFTSSFLILSIFLNYKLSMMSSFSKIYYILKAYTHKNEQALQSFSQQYMLYQVEIIIQKEIYKNNRENYVQVEKTFREDELKAKLTRLIHEANDSFIEKYKLLGQQICNLNIIDELCLKISNILRVIEGIWNQFEKKDSYNLKIYEIFLIYFEYIVLSKKQAAGIKTTILRKTQALQQLKGISMDNLERYLYTDRSCVIEVIFNKDKVGIITNISSSCEYVFKFSRDQILEKDLHELMPQYFANEHRRWTQQWLDNEVLKGKILGLVKTYFVDSAGNTFSCSLHMKVTSIGFKLRFYIMVIKDNSSDYLILNSNLEIHGIGSKLQVQQVFEMSSLKHSITQFTEANIKQLTDELVEGQTVKRRVIFRNQSNLNHSQKQMAFAIIGACSQISMKDPPEAYFYECSIIFERRVINRFNYFALKFYQIRKLIKHNSGFLFKTIAGTKDYDNVDSNPKFQQKKNKNQYEEHTMRDHNRVQSDLMLKESQDDFNSIDENKFQVNNMSSVAQSAIGQGNLLFSKLAQEIKEKSVHYKKVTDKRLNITTLGIIIMIILVGTSAWVQSYLFSRGMKSYNEIIFATSAVSNNNQILQSIFNYATNLNYFCSNASQAVRCGQLLQKSKVLTRRVFGYLISDIQVYLINKTSLTGIRYFSYYDDIVDLTFQNGPVSVSVKEFLSFYLYAVSSIRNSIKYNLTLSISNDETLQFLVNNWQAMKSINDKALTYYQTASQSQFNFLIFITYFMYSLVLSTLLVLIFLLNRYYTYIETKKENIIRLHGFLTHVICGKLRQVGQGIRQCLGKSYIELETNLDLQSLRQSKQRSQFRYQPNKKYNYYLVFFFLLMTTFNTFILYQIASLFSPATNIMAELTLLIQSENTALQSYLQAKSLYLFNYTAVQQQKAIKEVISIVNTTQIQFTANARSIQRTIAIMGGDFAGDFNKMLIKNVCNLTVSQMSISPRIDNCSKNMNYPILELGPVAAITFIIRNVMGAVMDLIKSTANKNIFLSTVFDDADNYIYYLFNIYQLIEQQIIDGMDKLATNITNSVRIIIAIQFIVLLIAILIWISRINKEKKNLSNLYGQVLQLPQAIFRENKIILKILEENLTLKL